MIRSFNKAIDFIMQREKEKEIIFSRATREARN